MLGAVALRLLVLPRRRVLGDWREGAPGAEDTCSILGLGAALVLVLLVPLILAAQTVQFRDPFEPLGAELALLLTGTLWGRMWQLQMIAVILAVGAFTAARVKGRTIWWVVAGAATILVASTPALSGHSFGAQRFTTLVVVADALHVIGAGTWLGTLAALIVVAGVARGRGAALTALLPGTITAFSPLALVAAGTLGVTGLLGAWLNVGSFGALVDSGYGRLLLVKLGLVGVVLGLGAYNWKRVTARLHTSDGTGTFMSSSARWELAVGLGVLLATAFLVVVPLPMEP